MTTQTLEQKILAMSNEEFEKRIARMNLPKFLDNAEGKIVSVYSGRPGCACGCRGNHSENPATIKKIVKKMLALQPVIERDGNNFSLETDTRLYIAYVSKDVF